MDDAGGLRRGPALLDGPSACFFRTDGEVRLQAEQIIAGMDELRQAGLLQADGFKKLLLLFVRERRDLSFQLRADDDARGVLLLGALLHTRCVRVAAGSVGL